MKLYTKTGDSGQTGLFGGVRVPKHDSRIEAYGTIDELNACVGVVLAGQSATELTAILDPIQDELFTLGCHLATPYSAGQAPDSLPPLPANALSRMEQQIDTISEQLPALTNFIIPGGVATAAYVHVARTVCRRAERRVTALASSTWIDPLMTQYLNRLSDLLFVLARFENQTAGQTDIIWKTR